MRHLLVRLLIVGYLCAQPFHANAQTWLSAPQFPAVKPDIAYPPDAGYTITAVASGANLQTAITAAACGTKLNLAHDGSWTSATAYTLPNNSCACHTDQKKWIILQGDQFAANYTPGVRTDPSAQYHQYPHITSTDINYTFTALANGASCWGFAGLDVTNDIADANALFEINDGTQTTANFSHDFAFWGDYLHGKPTQGLRRALSLNGNFETVVDSYLSDGHQTDSDAQAIHVFDGLGGGLIRNNFLEGSTENILFGGLASQSLGTLTADFTITGNDVFKPLAWRFGDPSYAGIHWLIKNSFELKLGQRLLVTGNIFENCWGDGQTGQPIPWNTGSQNGLRPGNTIQDVNFYYNIIRHAAGVYVFSGNTGNSNQPDHRLNIHDNLSYDIDDVKWAYSFSGRNPTIQLDGANAGNIFPPYDVWLDHETISTAGNLSTAVAFGGSGNPLFHYGIKFTNSIVERGANGAIYSVAGGDEGNVVITTNAPNGKFDHDCLIGSGFSSYTNGAFAGLQKPATQALVYVNPGVDFHVSASSICHNASSTNTDIGAPIDTVLAATVGAVVPLANLHSVTNVSPATFTHLGSTSITITGTNFIQESGLGVLVGGAGPASAISIITCAVNTCTVVMSAPITLAVNDTVNVFGMVPGVPDQGQFIVASVANTTHFTYTDTSVGTQNWTGGTANRVSPGNPCTSVTVVSATSITCTTPAASGTVTNGLVGVSVSQFGIPIQSTVFGTYN